MAALLLLTGPKAGSRHEVGAELTVGRSPSCEIPLDDEKVSRRHARIEVRGGETWLSDLGSKNGTFLNGVAVAEKVTLRGGDQVQIGETTLVFEPDTAAALSEASPGDLRTTPLEEVLPLAGADGALFSASLAFMGAASEGAVLRRAAEELLRAAAADVAAVLRREGATWRTAAVRGAPSVEVPRLLAQRCVEHREAVLAAGRLAVPLVASGGAPVGLLYAARAAAFDARELQLAAALGRLCGERLAALSAQSEDGGPFVAVGGSREHQRIIDACVRAASADQPVAVQGPAGSGRTFFARYLHFRSPRRAAGIVVVDCAAPAAEQQLFGRRGQAALLSALARAEGGTLLCENLDRLPAEATQRLLGHLAGGGSALPLPGGEAPAEVWLVATYATPPPTEIFADRVVVIPPLEERRADVVPLFESFLAKFAARARRPAPVVPPETAAALTEAPWPGGVRSVEALAERIVANESLGPILAPDALPPSDVTSSGGRSLHDRVARLERDAIAAALREAGGKKIRAAELLGISRPTLDKKIAEYGLTVERAR